MAGKGNIRKVFPGGNTSCGFYSFYDYILPQEEATRIFVIKGGPGVGKSTFMTKIGTEMVNRGYDVEYLQCSSDNDSLDGILIPALKIALIDGTAPHVVDPKNPGVVDEIINLGEYWDTSKIAVAKNEVMKISKRVARHYKTAYSLLKESKVAYDEWKSYVVESVDSPKYNEILRILLGKVFEDAAANYNSAPKARHLFASAITPGGLTNHANTLIKPDMKVYAIEGPPGCGVKEMIFRSAQTACEFGFFTEQFHCPFEPECLDMVIIHDIKSVIVNTSRPFHLDIASIENSAAVNKINLDACIKKDVLEEYKQEIGDAKERFYSLLSKAVSNISKAKSLHDKIESYYVSAMDFQSINEKREEVLQRILKLTQVHS